jgi:hypothetical protein
VRQVGHLLELYRDTSSTKRKNKTHTQNMQFLSLFHGSNIHMNAPERYFIRKSTLPVLLELWCCVDIVAVVSSSTLICTDEPKWCCREHNVYHDMLNFDLDKQL